MNPEQIEVQVRAAIATGDIGETLRLGAILSAEDDLRQARLSAPEALPSAAHWYGLNGIAVFPLRPRDKRPYPGSSGFKDATTDITTIDGWWTERPDSNIGAPTGLLFDVIDIDGWIGWRSIIDHDIDLAGRIARSNTTRPGGCHIFVTPTGRGNGAHLFPGIDMRGKGGYVALPPSVGANGKRYEWIQPLQFGEVADA